VTTSRAVVLQGHEKRPPDAAFARFEGRERLTECLQAEVGVPISRVSRHSRRTRHKEPLMRAQLVRTATLAVAALTLALPGLAKEGNATAAEATAMVKKGVAFIKANGKEKGYAEITSKGGQFTDRDLYLVVYGLDGVVHAHGANEKMVGKNLIDLKDVDGKAFVKERVELGKSKGTFWQDYKFTNPVTKKIEPKSMYCEKLDEAVVCGGIYK
jgi:cytochrome c